ncbi:MAG: primosomal protein N' [Actinomycetota bacterium]
MVPLVPAWRLDRAFTYLIPAGLAGQVQAGSLVRVPFGHRSVRGIVVALDNRAADGELAEVKAVVGPAPVAPPPMPDLLRWVARRYAAPLGRAFERAVPPRVRVALPALASVPARLEPRLVSRYRGGTELLAAIARSAGGPWCLRAAADEDRGRAIAELVSAAASTGRAALVCVPEVHHGSAVIAALQTAFPSLARLDSGTSDHHRSAGWFRLAGGELVGAGGRSAVFAPSPRLGLLVVDEEHHITYKEDRAPRYDARCVAVRRAALQDAVCVFVSATPSVETGERARSGAFGSVEPARQTERGARPIVELLEHPPDRALSHDLHVRVRDCLAAGERVALLAPARGYARSLWCTGCRRSVRCEVCEAGMFLDRSPRRMRCPRCGNQAPPPEACAHCGSADFAYMGAGSERLAEQIAASFPRAVVRRADAAPSGGPVEDGAPAPDIYVTTWIGTKETVRPDVALVGVLDADALIRRPDFRAAERAYQALAEMARWAGPADRGGRLLIQTAEPGHHAVQAVARADYGYFLDRELEQRRELSYPPYSELVKVTASGPAAAALVEAATGAARSEGGRVLGPIALPARAGVPASERGALQILVKCHAAEVVAARLGDILPRTPAGSRLRVDVDPR